MSEQEYTPDSDSTHNPLPTHHFDGDISLIEIANIVLKSRRLIVSIVLILLITIIGYTYSRPCLFSASASFLPQYSSAQNSWSSNIASQLGVSLPAGDTVLSPKFYSYLISTREILSSISKSQYEIPSGEDSLITTLPELFGIDDEKMAVANEKCIQQIRDIISIELNQETALISYSVRTRWPTISRDIAIRILDLLNQFNLNRRQTQATEERIFIEGRLKEVGEELLSAENALEEFLQQNSQYTDSHTLTFVYDRLFRDVQMLQQVITMLNQAYEQARIDEVRDTPVITVVENPVLPIFPDSRNLKLMAFLALIGGGLLGLVAAFGREFMIQGRQLEADQFSEYERLKKETIADIKNPFRILSFHRRGTIS